MAEPGGRAGEVAALDQAVDQGRDRGPGQGQTVGQPRGPVAPVVDHGQDPELGQRQLAGAALEQAGHPGQGADGVRREVG